MTMDVRKAHPATVARSTSGRRWSTGISTLREEFKKINWTTKDELKTYTKIVVGATFVVGLGLYVIDLLARASLSGLGALVRAVIG